jgi:O-acetyl-ADP-ribose deacetylase (regulator of RNase III)
MKKLFKNIQFEAVIGDIAKQPDVEALVNAANAQLQTGGGVAGAIHRAAGSELYEECRNLAPIKPGEAVITKAYNLPNSYIIHCLGPVYGKDSPEEKLLANCYKNALRLAEKHQISSIAFPSLSTGAFGYPIEEAVNVSFNAILSELQGLKHLQRIKFVLFSEQDLKFYLKKIEDLN